MVGRGDVKLKRTYYHLRSDLYSLRSGVRERDWLFVASVIFQTEWNQATANDYKTWPHCCTQAGCWKHTQAQSCHCKCVWCKIARKAGK